MVKVTRDTYGYHIALRGALYLSNDLQFSLDASGLGGGGATLQIDPNSLKVNAPW